LRYPYEVRSEKEYFDDIQDVKITKDMLTRQAHRREKSATFEPENFDDRYESALIDLINQSARLTTRRSPRRNQPVTSSI